MRHPHATWLWILLAVAVTLGAPLAGTRTIVRPAAAGAGASDTAVLDAQGAPAAAPSAAEQLAYPHGDFRADCGMCHRPDAWKPARIGRQFDHERYGFALRGAHLAVPCRQCHASLDFATASTECSDCHADVHQGELGTDCSRCHGTRSFVDRGDQVRMHRLTRFPLAGAHSTLDCESCHALQAGGALSYVATSTECDACHLADYTGAKNPDHVAGAFSHDCTLCHNDQGWSRTNFDHAGTRFPLTGAHAVTPCADCHVGGTYGGLSTECVACHRDDYDATTDPAHQAAGFPTTCQECHGTAGWDGASFDHGVTGFALIGAHRSVQCLDCHVGGNFATTSPLCASCHQDDYDATTTPAHLAAGFPTTCGDCHTTVTWSGARFDHDARWFPIYSGRHATEWDACSDCHMTAGNFADFNCLNCHPHSDRANTDGHHQGESGYRYDSAACYECHPDGRS